MEFSLSKCKTIHFTRRRNPIRHTHVAKTWRMLRVPRTQESSSTHQRHGACVARPVPPGTLKTLFDAWNGYKSLSLCEEDMHLTMFITLLGRYRYRTTSQGYIASGDWFSWWFYEFSGGQLLPSMSLAGLMWTKRYHTQSGQICLCSRYRSLLGLKSHLIVPVHARNFFRQLRISHYHATLLMYTHGLAWST